MLSRRELIATGAVMLTTLPMMAQGRAAGRSQRVGVLISGDKSDRSVRHRLTVFLGAMQQLGWVDGRNVSYEVRWGNSNRDRLAAGAAELAQLAPDAVLTIGTPATRAMHDRSKTFPIIFAIVSDPVGDGFVEGLSRPGGNVTGFITYYPEFVEKWIELLKETAPRTARTALLFNPRTAPFARNQYLQPFLEQAAKRLAIEPLMLPVTTETEIRSAFEKLTRRPDGSIIVMPDSFMIANRDTIIGLSQKHSLPVIYPFGPFAYRGGLIAYGVNMADLTRRAATYVDRVLKGERTADLPVQAPTKFELVVNLKTAETMGLNVPMSVLVRATEVIE